MFNGRRRYMSRTDAYEAPAYSFCAYTDNIDFNGDIAATVSLFIYDGLISRIADAGVRIPLVRGVS